MSELMKKAALVGVSPDEIADAQDEENPKERLAALIDQRDLRVELAALMMSTLMKRAHAAGVTQDAVADAQDAGSPRDVPIDLVIEAERGGQGVLVPVLERTRSTPASPGRTVTVSFSGGSPHRPRRWRRPSGRGPRSSTCPRRLRAGSCPSHAS